MRRTLCLLLFFIVLLPSCKKQPSNTETNLPSDVVPSADEWDGVKRADITYQLLLYSFADGDGDSIGDLKGLTGHLDYINALGASAVWLSPIHPSPSYHGYDVIDYTSINKDFGTEDDFKNFLEKAHSLGIKVYMDFVLNHTSSSHEWFQQAVKDAGSEYRDYYIFSNNPKSDIESGNIPMMSSEGPAAYNSGQWFKTSSEKTIYFHSHFNTASFADLNYGKVDNCKQSPAFMAITDAAAKWIDAGVDGFRLDAVKHIYHNAYSTENPRFLAEFYEFCNNRYKSAGGKGDFYIIGEMNDEADKVAPYYKGLPAFFEFSFWYRLEWAINNSTGCWFVKDINGYEQQYSGYRKKYIEATKLTNHDEDRAASRFDRSIEKEKLAAAVLLTSAGSPYIYQGEELGYWGDRSGGDEYVRTPVMWDRNGQDLADGYLRGKVDRSMLTPDISVEAQEGNAESLLSTYMTFTRLRNTYVSLARGSMTPHISYNSDNTSFPSLAVWYRVFESEKMLVVHNFGDSSISVNFNNDDLSRPVGLQGKASVVDSNGHKTLTVGPYSSVIFMQ